MNPDSSGDLPDPPLVAHLLLENPWPLALTLLALAAVFLIRAHRAQARGPVVGAVLCAGLAIGAWGLAAGVTTQREHLVAQTRELVDSTLPLDTTVFSSLFAPDATLRGPAGERWLSVEQMVAELAGSKHRLRSHRVREVQAWVQRPGRALTKLRISTVVGSTRADDRAVPTEWLITWEPEDSGSWRIERIQWVKLLGQRPWEGAWR